MKYLFFTLLMAFALFSCTPDEIAKPIDTPEILDARELIVKSPAFARFLETEPAKGWDDETFKIALDDFGTAFEAEVTVILSRKPENYIIDTPSAEHQPLLYDFIPKAGPCTDSYAIEVEHAAVDLGICTAGSDGIGDIALCIVSYGNEMIKADRQYNACLASTYPNGHGG